MVGSNVKRSEPQRCRKRDDQARYTTLDRLEQKGIVRSRIGEPTPERGGRRRKYFELTAPGARAVRDAYNA